MNVCPDLAPIANHSQVVCLRAAPYRSGRAVCQKCPSRFSSPERMPLVLWVDAKEIVVLSIYPTEDHTMADRVPAVFRADVSRRKLAGVRSSGPAMAKLSLAFSSTSYSPDWMLVFTLSV